jgi:hypothetical protein
MATKEMRKFSNVSAKSCFSNLEMKLRQKPGRGGIAGELCKVYLCKLADMVKRVSLEAGRDALKTVYIKDRYASRLV